MVEKNIGKIIVLFGLILVIEMGIGVWRLPKEFRSEIIPRTERLISKYSKQTELEARLAFSEKMVKYLFERSMKHTHIGMYGKPKP